MWLEGHRWPSDCRMCTEPPRLGMKVVLGVAAQVASHFPACPRVSDACGVEPWPGPRRQGHCRFAGPAVTASAAHPGGLVPFVL